MTADITVPGEPKPEKKLRRFKCPDCHGAGRGGFLGCSRCEGTGRLYEKPLTIEERVERLERLAGVKK